MATTSMSKNVRGITQTGSHISSEQSVIKKRKGNHGLAWGKERIGRSRVGIQESKLGSCDAAKT